MSVIRTLAWFITGAIMLIGILIMIGSLVGACFGVWMTIGALFTHDWWNLVAGIVVTLFVAPITFSLGLVVTGAAGAWR